MKKKILVMLDFYLPGIKGGGPIQSIRNLVDHFSNQVDFYIVTADRDFGDTVPFPDIKADKWLQVGKAQVYYTCTANLTVRKTVAILRSVEYDLLYINSLFSFKFSIVPIILSKYKFLQDKPVILAPRGQLSDGAMGMKTTKKRWFIQIANGLNLYDKIIWHATAAEEKREISENFSKDIKVKVASNLTSDHQHLSFSKKLDKQRGDLKVVFVSRIHPKKNLKKAIYFLKHVSGSVTFNIYGPLEDEAYWAECRNEIDYLPKNVTVNYIGLIPHSELMGIFHENHIFLFPTLGENFGHVISEALIGGCPVIISDQTPWRDLEQQGAGWDIPLANEGKFTEILQYCVDMDNEAYKDAANKAFEFGKAASNSSADITAYHQLFEITK